MYHFGSIAFAAIFAFIFNVTFSKVYNFETEGAIKNNNTEFVFNKNRDLLQSLLDNLEPFDELYIPNSTFHLNGGILVGDKDNNPLESNIWALQHVRIVIDGTLSFQNNRDLWPKASDDPDVERYVKGSNNLKSNQDVFDAFQFYTMDNVTFTSNKIGTFEGNGEAWWGYINYLVHNTDRPKMMNMWRSRNILWENLLLKAGA